MALLKDILDEIVITDFEKDCLYHDIDLGAFVFSTNAFIKVPGVPLDTFKNWCRHEGGMFLKANESRTENNSHTLDFYSGYFNDYDPIILKPNNINGLKLAKFVILQNLINLKIVPDNIELTEIRLISDSDTRMDGNNLYQVCIKKDEKEEYLPCLVPKFQSMLNTDNDLIKTLKNLSKGNDQTMDTEFNTMKIFDAIDNIYTTIDERDFLGSSIKPVIYGIDFNAIFGKDESLLNVLRQYRYNRTEEPRFYYVNTFSAATIGDDDTITARNDLVRICRTGQEHMLFPKNVAALKLVKYVALQYLFISGNLGSLGPEFKGDQVTDLTITCTRICHEFIGLNEYTIFDENDRERLKFVLPSNIAFGDSSNKLSIIRKAIINDETTDKIIKRIKKRVKISDEEYDISN